DRGEGMRLPGTGGTGCGAASGAMAAGAGSPGRGGWSRLPGSCASASVGAGHRGRVERAAAVADDEGEAGRGDDAADHGRRAADDAGGELELAGESGVHVCSLGWGW